MKMIECNAQGCTTRENSEINGKIIKLFSFPTHDDSLVKQWEENCKIENQDDKNLENFKVCELHFDCTSFVNEDKNVLVSGAVPTIFESNNKRKINEEKKIDEVEEETPSKQKKLEHDEESTPSPQNLKIQTESKTVPNKDAAEEKIENRPLNKSSQFQNNSNKNPKNSTSVFTKQIDMGKKVYRLIIRIDKVIDNKKKELNQETKPVVKQLSPELKPPTIKRSTTEAVVKNEEVTNICSKVGCKLTKTKLNSKPVFKCERCNKFYIVKTKSKCKKRKNVTCYICKEVLADPDILNFHIKKHFTCDMCKAQCTTQISFDKHIRLHVSTDPLLPYKCNKCSSTFEVKAEVKEHYAETHSKTAINNGKQDTIKDKSLFRCKYCYAVFTKEEAYNNHVELHMGEGEFDCSLCSKKFKTSHHLATHQARHLGAVKFTCRVCSKEFTSFENVEKHMKIHLDIVKDEHKCNICKKLFENEESLNAHMRGHLSRAHRCPLCKKAFINKTTLRIHFKTHNKVPQSNSAPIDESNVPKKQHVCTLCPSKFDSRSQLYNHIMTHLEQMHGVDGGEVVLEGLDELLETDEDILS